MVTLFRSKISSIKAKFKLIKAKFELIIVVLVLETEVAKKVVAAFRIR